MKSFVSCPSFSVLILLLALGGCAGSDVTENNPKLLYEEAEEDIKDDRYELATEKLRKIKNKFPYSKYSEKALLRLADVYYLQENFLEAAGSYETFVELHPKSERVTYAMSRIGEAYFDDAPTNIARDQSSAHKALAAFEDLLKKHPKGGHVKKTQENILKSRNRIAEKELYIARFYFVRSLYESSRLRFKKISKNYPDTDAAKKISDDHRKTNAIVKKRLPDPPRSNRGTPMYQVYLGDE